MTVLIGILCDDGIVIGTDSAATSAASAGNGQVLKTIEQPCKKLEVVQNSVLVACTGSIGLAQRFSDVVDKAYTEKIFTKGPIDVGKQLSARGQKDFIETGARPGSIGGLVGFSSSQHGFNLCEFGTADFQPELKQKGKLRFVSMGSGQVIADPFLAFVSKAIWENGNPSVQVATFTVIWVLEHVIEVNPGGVNAPMQIGVLSKGAGGSASARLVPDAEIAEHRQQVTDIYSHLRQYPNRFSASNPAPAIPPLASKE